MKEGLFVMSKNAVSISAIEDFILQELDGVVPKASWGEDAFFYNPGQVLKNGTYFTTIKKRDGENDRASNLDRENLWRLNIGVERNVFEEMFGPRPARPAKGCVIEGPWDFSEIDLIMPHPVYGWMGWLAVVSPSEETFEVLKPLIRSAHKRATDTFAKRMKHGC